MTSGKLISGENSRPSTPPVPCLCCKTHNRNSHTFEPLLTDWDHSEGRAVVSTSGSLWERGRPQLFSSCTKTTLSFRHILSCLCQSLWVPITSVVACYMTCVITENSVLRPWVTLRSLSGRKQCPTLLYHLSDKQFQDTTLQMRKPYNSLLFATYIGLTNAVHQSSWICTMCHRTITLFPVEAVRKSHGCVVSSVR